MRSTQPILLSLIFTLSLLCNFSYAQNGYLKVHIGGEDIQFNDEYPSVLVYKEGVKKRFIASPYPGNDFDVALPPGNYTIELYLEKDYLAQTAKNIVIVPGEITRLSLNGYHSYIRETKDYNSESKDRIFTNTAFNLQLGNSFINKNPNFNGYYDFGLSTDVFYALSKNIAFGPHFGTGLSFAYFNKSAYLDQSYEHKTERYSYWDFNVGLIWRISTSNLLVENFNGLILDLGINYNLPLLFRHVEDLNGKERRVERGFHQFNDFSVHARLGYTYASFIAEYRLTNYLKSGYHEQPKLRLGISFMIPSE